MKHRTQTVFFGDVAVVTVATGTTDLRLACRLLRLLDQGHSQILVDLHELRSLDSGRIEELLLCRTRAVESGGDLKLLKPRRAIRQMLEMTHLDSVLDVHTSLASALSSFSRRVAAPTRSARRTSSPEAPTPVS